MIKELIKIANELDNRGLAREADVIDDISFGIPFPDTELDNGAVIVLSSPVSKNLESWVVIARYRGEYVVWDYRTEDMGTDYGKYFKEFDDAMNEYASRIGSAKRQAWIG